MDYFFFLASKHRRLPAVLYQGFLSTKTQVLQFTELRVIRISSAVISGRLLWSTLARLFNTYTPKANFMTTWRQTMWFSRTGLVILIPWSLTLGRAPQLMRQWRTQWQRLNRKSTANYQFNQDTNYCSNVSSFAKLVQLVCNEEALKNLGAKPEIMKNLALSEDPAARPQLSVLLN